jgi:hypothetical protein
MLADTSVRRDDTMVLLLVYLYALSCCLCCIPQKDNTMERQETERTNPSIPSSKSKSKSKDAANRYSFEFAAGWMFQSNESFRARLDDFSDFDRSKNVNRFRLPESGRSELRPCIARRRPRSVLRVFHTFNLYIHQSIHTNIRIRKHNIR